MPILAIDTSCDETAAAVTEGRRVLSNMIYSQVLLHKKWGGVVPSIAKRAHEERIDFVINEALRKLRLDNNSSFSNLDYIAVTIGPGLAIALEVGINKAKELARKYDKKIIPVNHMEGHIYSCFVQNKSGNPKREFDFPYLALLVSGGHTELVIFKNHVDYQMIGATIDDAAGEALDKAAKMLGLGYPGGAVIERLAAEAGNKDFYHFPRPMIKAPALNFSFSGLKTSFYYFVKKMSDKERATKVRELASSFQEAVFDSLLNKTEKAIRETGINRLVVGGGVIANQYLRKKLRQLTKRNRGEAIFPPFKYLTGDNAAMIGVVAYYKAKKGILAVDPSKLDRIPRLSLSEKEFKE